ncbi:hypothetical protein D3P09_22055 [Paenibacillus pinisoli]|uniref:Uncharacterized protein n=1 Tax=Paenibacillus pinisoli TaxID=1276110 RepID=A0A3A6PHK4_9BACL|nr:hypothetical protein [Paenibacillus pinisoli]RJX37659.1 hypothetical protein D3P09_22055 [Paenibacillus pinisoli]
MSKLLKNNFFAAIFMTPFIASIFLLNYFWFWFVFSIYILLLGIYLILLTTSGLNHITNRAKRGAIRTIVGIAGIGLIVFFFAVFSPVVFDIGPYLRNEVKVVIGKNIDSSTITTKSKTLWHDIKIQNQNQETIELKSVYAIANYEIRTIRAVYLPHSKYVLVLQVME